MLIGLACTVLLGCGGTSRRLSEREALQYKRELIFSKKREIAPGQARQLFYHPARTRDEIDRAFEVYAEKYAQEKAREASHFSESRRSTLTGPDADDPVVDEPDSLKPSTRAGARQTQGEAKDVASPPPTPSGADAPVDRAGRTPLTR